MTLPDHEVERFRADPLADYLNMDLVAVRPGFARAEMDAAEELCSFHGYLQGGVIVALADYAFAAASNSHGVSAVALSLQFTFLGRVRPGQRLVAEATEEKRGRRIGLYRLVVTEGENLVASGQGTAYMQDPGGS